MRPRLVILTATLVLFFAVDVSATCHKCREQSCFQSEGTNAWCKGITNGCFAGGTCSGGCEGAGCGPEEIAEGPSLVEEYQLVSVTIKSEKQVAFRVARAETTDAATPID